MAKEKNEGKGKGDREAKGKVSPAGASDLREVIERRQLPVSAAPRT